MSKIKGLLLWVTLIFMFNGEIVEGKEIPLTKGTLGLSQNGSSNVGGTPSNTPAIPNHHGRKGKRQRVPKPERDPRSNSKTTKRFQRKKKQSGKDSRQQDCQRKKERRKFKALEETSVAEVITKKIGSGPILKHYIEKMGVVPIIDRSVPKHPSRKITHGEMVAALMIYQLCGGRALYRMEKWAQETAILSYIFPQYQASEWTDDRIDDTLEALYKVSLEGIQGSISPHIVETFGIRLEKIHYDTTSVSMWGTYDSSTGQPAVMITFGHSKAHRPDLKQIVMGMAVSGDGGVPIISGTHDGNTSDSVLPITYWERLRQVAGTSSFCFIGDCKVASLKTLKNLCTENGKFLAPMPMTESEQKRLINLLKTGELTLDSVDLESEKPLKPIYKKRTARPGNRRKESDKGPDSYKVCEESWEIQDNQRRSYNLRKLIIHSDRLASQKEQTRQRHLQKAEKQLQELRQKLNKRNLITWGAIESAVKGILRKCKVQGLIGFEIEGRVALLRKKVGRGRPGPNSQYVIKEKITYDLKIWRKPQAIAEKSMLDGFFFMVSNLDSQQWSVPKLLSLYKRQYKVEHVFRVLKTPLAVSPMLLEKADRICSMMAIMTLTLQLYTLIQRQASQEIERRDFPLDGLMPNRIQTWRPQTDNLLDAFDNINFIEIQQDGQSSLYLTTLTPLQLEILQILGVPAGDYSVDAFSQNSEET